MANANNNQARLFDHGRSASLMHRELERLSAVLPRPVAISQATWLIDQRVARLYKQGFLITEIAELMGVGAQVIARRLRRALDREGKRSPLEIYFDDETDILNLTAIIYDADCLPDFIKRWHKVKYQSQAKHQFI